MTALEHATQMVKSGQYVESQGKNRSKAIDALCNEFGVPLGSPWCALFASKAFRLAGAGGAFPYGAGSQSMLAWFKRHGKVSTDPQDLLKWTGALIIRTDPGGKKGHVAMVAQRLTDKAGKVVALQTVEGNTDSQGGRDGDGAYERKRTIPLRPHKWTFIDVSGIPGGDWWN